MTENKRFKLNYQGQKIVSCHDGERTININEMCDLLNELHEKNQHLKQELKNIYNIATINKAIKIIEKKYDDYLYDNDTECIPCKRKAYIECLELLDDFKEDLEYG